MATQGPLFPGTTASVSAAPESSDTWTNPGNIVSDNGSEAQITAATYDANDISFQLRATNFGFTIPAGAAIDGVTVEIDRRVIAASAVDNRVQLFNGALIGNNKASATAWPSTSTVATYGSASDVWGATLTDSIINGSGFGVVLSVKATGANTDIGVDFIRVTVNYTLTEPPPATGSGSPVATLGKTASGTATQTFTGSGTPTKTLGATATGAASQTFTGSGAPTTTLGATASGDASEQFTGSGSPAASLDATASGDATMTPDAPGPVSGSGAPVASLDPTASGSAAQTFSGSGVAVATLSAFASGTATMTPGGEEEEHPPRRRGKGRYVFINAPPEPTPPIEEELEREIIEADPLPDLPEMPPLRTTPRVNTRGITLPVARTNRVARTVQQSVSDDEDAFLQILLSL